MSGVENFRPAPVKPVISLADLDRIDVRVGKIVAVGDIAGSDKLVKLTVDFGDCRREILAGIKQERSSRKRLKAGKRCSWLTLRRRRCWARCRKECFSI